MSVCLKQDGEKVLAGDLTTGIMREAIGAMDADECRAFFVKLFAKIGMPPSKVRQIMRCTADDLLADMWRVSP
jgi:hypothetical protein